MEMGIPIVAPGPVRKEPTTPGNMLTVTPHMLLSVQVDGQGSLLKTGPAQRGR